MIRVALAVFSLLSMLCAGEMTNQIGSSFLLHHESSALQQLALKTDENSAAYSAPVGKNSLKQVAPQLDTAGLSADEFKKVYWHSRVDSADLNKLSDKDPRAGMFISGVLKFNKQDYAGSISEFERSIVYSDAYRELSVLYLYRCYFEMRNYKFAFMVLQNYYSKIGTNYVKDEYLDELIKTSTFLASQISSEHFWSTDSLAEYQDYLSQKDSLFTIIRDLDPKRKYNLTKLNKELAYTAYAQGKFDIGDSLSYLLLETAKSKEVISWAYKKIKEYADEPIADFYDLLTLANAEWSTGKHAKAITSYTRLLKKKPSKTNKIEITRRLAYSLKRTKKFKAAIKKYKYLVNNAPAHANDFLNLARCYRSLEQKKSAQRWYGKFAKRFPKHTKALEISWTKGFEFEQSKNLAKALKAYNAFPKSQKKTKRGKWIGFRKGYVEYKRGRLSRAIKFFKAVTKNPELLWPGSASRLFIAKAYLRLKKKDLARDWFLKTIKDYPVGFYAYRARHHLIEQKLISESLIPKISFLELTENETIEWLRLHQKKRTEIPEDQFLEIETLLAVGCWDAAEKRYSHLYSQKVGRLDFMYQFSKLFLKYGNIAQSYRITRQMAWRIDRHSLMNPPRLLMELLYLRPYSGRVNERATKESINPYFVLALMRQESIFDSDIRSGAGAYGLMQIMPYTGKELARREKIKDFDSKKLFNPYLAIQLGTRYIGDLMKKWDSEYLVLTNYNAGPTPTKRWKEQNGDLELDMFVEEISYWETRDYVKKVMANYWTYQQVWNK